MLLTNAGHEIGQETLLASLAVICDYHSDGLIIVRPNQVMVYANESARQMFGNGICFASERIFFDNKSANKLFLRNLECLAGKARVQTCLMFSVPRKPGKLPLIVMHRMMKGLRYDNTAVEATKDDDVPLSCLIIRDPSLTGGFDQNVFGEMFSLTSAEKQLAVHFLEGEDLAAFAERREIVIDTARDHMKNLMAKCNVHKQSELMSLLMASWMDVL